MCSARCARRSTANAGKKPSASAANPAAGVLDSDLVVDGPGNNNAYGHVVFDLPTLTGVVTFSGGTGEFIHFHAGPIDVACPPLRPRKTWPCSEVGIVAWASLRECHATRARRGFLAGKTVRRITQWFLPLRRS